MNEEEKHALTNKLKQMETNVEERDSAQRESVPYKGNIKLETPDTETKLEPAPVEVRLVKFGMLMLGAALFFGIPYLLGSWLQIKWLMITGYVLGGLGALLAVVQTATAKIARCPFCNEFIGTTIDSDIHANDENERVACESCHEYVLSHQGTLRAFPPEETSRFRKFEAPVFVGARWPEECIVCGDAPTHFGNVTKHTLELGHLLLGAISVSKAALEGVPYCDEHDDDVSLVIRDEKMYLVFPTLEQQRRYLHINDADEIVRVKE